jgi:hypothetical protein
VGVLTAVLGGGYLLWLMHRGRGRQGGHVSAAALQTLGVRAALGGVEVLHGLDLSLPAGRWTCIVGPNGAGKSTLLKALAGLLPHTGQVGCWARRCRPCRAGNGRGSWPGWGRAKARPKT